MQSFRLVRPSIARESWKRWGVICSCHQRNFPSFVCIICFSVIKTNNFTYVLAACKTSICARRAPATSFSHLQLGFLIMTLIALIKLAYFCYIIGKNSSRYKLKRQLGRSSFKIQTRSELWMTTITNGQMSFFFYVISPCTKMHMCNTYWSTYFLLSSIRLLLCLWSESVMLNNNVMHGRCRYGGCLIFFCAKCACCVQVLSVAH